MGISLSSIEVELKDIDGRGTRVELAPVGIALSVGSKTFEEAVQVSAILGVPPLATFAPLIDEERLLPKELLRSLLFP